MKKLVKIIYWPLTKYDKIEEPWRFLNFFAFIAPFFFLPQPLQIISLFVLLMWRVSYIHGGAKWAQSK